MEYSVVGIVAIIINIVINRDVLKAKRSGNETKVNRSYRLFIYGVLAYLATDVLWGFLNQLHAYTLLYIDTIIYFVTMYFSVLLWTRFVVDYLGKKDGFSKALLIVGNILLIGEVAALIINHFVHFFFWIDTSGEYRAYWFRYLALTIQMVLFLITSIYAFINSGKKTDNFSKNKFRTVGIFGLVMIVAIIVQVIYPLMPFYAIGYMICTCVLHVFVVEEELSENQKTNDLVKMFASEYAAAFVINLNDKTCKVISNRANLPDFIVGSETTESKIKEHVVNNVYNTDKEKVINLTIDMDEINLQVPVGQTHSFE